jgi:hypothetical protein
MNLYVAFTHANKEGNYVSGRCFFKNSNLPRSQAEMLTLEALIRAEIGLKNGIMVRVDWLYPLPNP